MSKIITDISQYKNSGVKDIHGNYILEGSIINADGYNSNVKENRFHCVTYDKLDGFGSDIYSDFDKISSYKKIEVIGHCTEYAHLYNGEWEGNLGAAWKYEKDKSIDFNPPYSDEEIKNLIYYGKPTLPSKDFDFRLDDDADRHLDMVLEYMFKSLREKSVFNAVEVERVFWNRIKILANKK